MTSIDGNNEEDGSLLVSHAEQEDEVEETCEGTVEDGDGIDLEIELNPPPHTYTPSPPSNCATLATPPAMHSSISTSDNLARYPQT